MGAGSGFGVVLDAEDGQGLVANAFDSAVVEVDVGDFHIVRQSVWVDCETVVLRGDGDFAGTEILDGLIASTVAEFELVGFGSECVAKDLVAKADAKDGHFAEQLADFIVDVAESGGVAGAVGEEKSVLVHGEDFLSLGARVDDGDVESCSAEATEDVAFDAEVVGDDVVADGGEFFVVTFLAGADVGQHPVAGFILPVVIEWGGDFLNEVAAFHRCAATGCFYGFSSREISRDTGSHGASGAKMLGELARVDSLDTQDAVASKPCIKAFLGAPVGWDFREFFDYESANLWAGRLIVFIIHPVVADHGIGHCYNLSTIGWVAEYFLIPCHGGVEAGFPGGGTGGSERYTLKNCTVFKCEECLHQF